MDPVMRGFDFYWKNWKIAEEWRQRHYAASSAVYYAQNNVYPNYQQSEPLRMINHPLGRNRCKEEYMWEEYETCDDETGSEDRKKHSVNLYNNEEYNDSSDDSSDEVELEFVINEEMIAFFEQSMRHKEELKKQRELLEESEDLKGGTNVQSYNTYNENNCKMKEHQSTSYEISTQVSYEVPNVNFSSQKRIEDMKNLYGTAMPKICGMETALQLSFNRLCDHNKPVYWPCIPFSP